MFFVLATGSVRGSKLGNWETNPPLHRFCPHEMSLVQKLFRQHLLGQPLPRDCPKTKTEPTWKAGSSELWLIWGVYRDVAPIMENQMEIGVNGERNGNWGWVI